MRRLSIVVLLLVAACSTSETSPREQTTTSKLVPVSGQVFIVTKGRENIKLALTQVAALPESTTLNRVARCKDTMPKSVSAASAYAESVRVQAHAATEELKAATAASNALPPLTSDATLAALNKAQARLKRAMERASNLRTQLAEATSALEEASSSFSPYFLDFPQTIATTKADADGKFTLALHPGQRVALAAVAERETPGGTETYYWMVWFTPQKGADNQIMLCNDNLATSGSRESAFYGVLQP
jgi:hypothetical protein